MQPKVKKIPYSLDAANVSFDITEPQPQLFVTPDFDTLTRVLNEFADTMAIRTGGLEGIRKAILSENTGTCVYSSGLQVSGTFTEVLEKNGTPVYLRTTGPTNLNYKGKELPGQDKNYHKHGFSSPVGKLKNMDVPLETASETQLSETGIIPGNHVQLEFETGVKVKGHILELIRRDSRLLIIRFSDCQVNWGEKTLYEPSWGLFDMAVGASIVSCFSGPADPLAFQLNYPVPAEKTHKLQHTPEAKKLFDFYQQVRYIRENSGKPESLKPLWNELITKYPDDWLCALEILEILKSTDDPGFYHEVKDFLEKKKNNGESMKKLVEDGFALLQ
jgi:phenylalanine-4-hydroxylase